MLLEIEKIQYFLYVLQHLFFSLLQTKSLSCKYFIYHHVIASKTQSNFLPCNKHLTSFNSLTNDKILALVTLKAFAEDKFNVVKMMISVFDTVVNIVGKGEHAGNQHFLLFPQCFPQAFFLRQFKVGVV